MKKKIIALLKTLVGVTSLIILEYSCAGADSKPSENSITNENSKGDITICLRVYGKSKIYFDYIDTLFRNAVLPFVNITNSDTIIYRKIKSNHPVIFTNSFLKGNKLYRTQFLGLSGDTLTFSYKNNSLFLTDTIQSHFLTSKFFGVVDIAYNDREFRGNQIETHIEAIINRRNENIINLNELKANKKIDIYILQQLFTINNLQFYSDIFKIDYKHLKSRDGYPILDSIYKEAVKNLNAFKKIFSPQIKPFIYYLTQYASFKTHQTDKDLFTKLKYLDNSFFKTDLLDGFIYDLVINNDEIKTSADQKEILMRLKDILNEKNDFLKRTQSRQLDKQVLLSNFEDLQGNSRSFNDIIKTERKIVLIDFWASWCVPCIREFPHLKSIMKEYSDRVEIISISIDQDSLKWQNAYKRYDIRHNSYRNVLGKNNSFIKDLELSSIPRYIILNNSGGILEHNFYRPSHPKFKLQLSNILDSQH